MGRPDVRTSTIGRVDTRPGVLVRSLILAARGAWWCGRRLVGPGLVMGAWACWVWFTGRTWRHQRARRYVTRPVRAAGNWVVTAVVIGLVVAPVATLTVAGLALVALGTAVTAWQLRAELRDRWFSAVEWLGFPGAPMRDELGRYAIRVKAHVDREIRR